MKKKATWLILMMCGLMLSACASGGGGSDDSSDSSNNNTSSSNNNDDSSSEDSEFARQFTTDCGTVSGGLLVNPASTASAQLLSVVRAADSNLLVLRSAQGDLLVKLHAIGTSGRTLQAMDFMEATTTSQVYYIPAVADCTVPVNGGVAATGQIFTEDGRSIGEELIKAGLAGEIDSSGPCGEGLVSGCYSALREANTQRSAGEITDFLWKPEAESEFNAGNPVIHANPCDATVYVNGQPGTDFGPANGRCNTTRLFSRCGTYGSNIKVEIIDNASGLPYVDGRNPQNAFVIVPNGCSRFEFIL